jgi:predicted ATPase
MNLSCGRSNGSKKKNIEFFVESYGHVSNAKKGIADIFSYISADRFGPRTSLPLSFDSDIATVGDYGEYIVDFLYNLNSGRFDSLITPASIALDGKEIKNNIQAWLRVITPGIELTYNRYKLMDQGRLEWDGFRSAHVGFGLTYTLPVIASFIVHAAQIQSGNINDVLLLIENPEAHLHPAGQTMMGRLLALSAACGVQIVVETHSDHLLNGIRIAIKDLLLKPENARVFFFKHTDNGMKLINRKPVDVSVLEIDKYGMIDYWPEGFFDEVEKNLVQLL